MMEGGCCIFDNDEEEKAFMQWRVTDEGKFISNKSLIRYLLSMNTNRKSCSSIVSNTYYNFLYRYQGLR